MIVVPVPAIDALDRRAQLGDGRGTANAQP